ncbi:MAG: flagellar protein FlgN [Erythrobacter sp.]|jgi:hypothetical protein|nr:flagellar protein FlgN [Erythrobacter sp.]
MMNTVHNTGTTLVADLRQMIAVLETERQALADLEADALFDTARQKAQLCDRLSALGPEALDADTRSLAETAQRLNDANRRVRNLLAANVSVRLEMLGHVRGTSPTGGLALA